MLRGRSQELLRFSTCFYVGCAPLYGHIIQYERMTYGRTCSSLSTGLPLRGAVSPQLKLGVLAPVRVDNLDTSSTSRQRRLVELVSLWANFPRIQTFCVSTPWFRVPSRPAPPSRYILISIISI